MKDVVKAIVIGLIIFSIGFFIIATELIAKIFWGLTFAESSIVFVGLYIAGIIGGSVYLIYSKKKDKN